ncbi:MAG: anthranilate synthase component I family protein [Actinomycetes bacterium]
MVTTGTGLLVRPLPQVPRRADGRVDLDRVALALAPLLGAPAPMLESAPDVPATGDTSWVIAGVAGRLLHRDGRTEAAGALGRLLDGDADTLDPFAALDLAGERTGCTPDAERLPAPAAAVGLVGAIAYEAARHVERLGRAPASGLDLDLVLADVLVAVDHRDEHALLVHVPLAGPRRPTDLDAVEAAVAHAPDLPPLPRRAGGPARATTSLDPAAHRAALGRVLEHVAAGDTFQVNLTMQVAAPFAGDVHALYRAMRGRSPAPYGAVLWDAAGAGIASISPETFLLARGRQLTTRPIKGTRRRDADPVRDAALRDDLVASEKDRAENVMVVDMERNDLGRVCVPGSVRVPRLLEVEAHPTVWHLVSEVTGVLRDGVGWGRLLAATFPCGSVTGTPKVEAMRVIERLEPVPRGWYCGAIGAFGPGAATTAVAIRTATLSPDGVATYGTGGGIVADSDPDAEHAEALAKAAAFLQAVDAELDAAPAPRGRDRAEGVTP